MFYITPMIHFHEAQVTDIPFIRDIAHRVWPQSYADILSPAQMEYMLDMMYSEASLLRQIRTEHHHFILVLDEKEPIGFASWSPTPAKNKFRLHKIYLLNSRHNQGIGRKLLQEVIRAIAPSDQSILELNVNRQNKAISFYEHQGFQIVRREDKDIGNGFFMNDYVMQKII